MTPQQPIVDVVVVGQTPPPVHGQAMMVEALMRMAEPDVRLHLVRLGFSRDLGEVGRLKAGKLVELVAVCRRVRRAQRETRARTLYLAVGGASLVPLVRDAVLLGLTRHRFDRVILHVHGAGVGYVLGGLPRPLRVLVQAMLGRPSVVVALAPESPPDATALRARTVVTIPNGIPDQPTTMTPAAESPLRILYLGTLRESKGVLALVRAVAILRSQGVDVTCTLAGGVASAEFGATLAALVESDGLAECVAIPGQLDDAAKAAALASHDVFAFPSYYEGENQSVAVVEAMRAGLPVVAADWRGARSLVSPELTGVLVPARDDHALAAALSRLAASPSLRQKMGAAGRKRYLESYTEATFLNRFAELFRSAA